MLGETARANQAIAFLERLQNPSGGFFGSYGVAADYFPAEEISWASAAAVDACQRRIAAHLPAPPRPRTTSHARFVDAGLIAPPMETL